MFRQSRGAQASVDEPPAAYDLDWPPSQRWNPNYNVPRNSLEPVSGELRSENKNTKAPGRTNDGSTDRSHLASQSNHGDTSETKGSPGTVESTHKLSDLSHWLETLAEIYMNQLENRARWDPRWLSITRRERFEGLTCSTVTILDYLDDEPAPHTTEVTDKAQLSISLQSRPRNCAVRVLMVNDLSRFTMGALGQLYAVDPEFWFEHLANSGYAASDSQLKVSSAVWMNWAQRETRFRHRPLPGTGQRTQWNSPRRARKRTLTHVRWGRLGLLHYLGKKGFHEDEIEYRLHDGRWLVERDVLLDKHGYLMTTARLANQAEKEKASKAKGKEKSKKKVTFSRAKGSNIYRAYSTFDGLPKNVVSWTNRDLRVVAPEGTSYWSGQDEQGLRTVIILFDPTRYMKHSNTDHTTPSLTFMPRAMEVESYSDEELWRTADVDETFLDPPPPLQSKTELKKRRKQEKAEEVKQAKARRRAQETKDGNDDAELGIDPDPDSESEYTSDSEYDEDYENELREEYKDPKPHARDRDFARKYALSTCDLVQRYLCGVSTRELVQDESLIPSLLNRLVLDDFWQLLAEMRLELDHLDNDLTATLYEHLVESVGNSARQNLTWMRSMLRELQDWSAHLQQQSLAVMCSPQDMVQEIKTLNQDLEALQSRSEQTMNLLVASMALAQSTTVIDQTSGINKLTELAFFFIPISFITSVFSMQVAEMSSNPPGIWIWGLTLGLVALTTYLIRISLRSPSVRIMVLHCRATINNRFASSKVNSASRRLNTVGNRAIAKFLFFFTTVMAIIGTLLILVLVVLLLALVGIWLGAVAIALYFIITRWPDPAVLVPCFIAIPVAVAGMFISANWADEMGEWARDVLLWSGDWIKKLYPTQWTLEKVDDEDLAKEGVNTYARQALVLAT